MGAARTVTNHSGTHAGAPQTRDSEPHPDLRFQGDPPTEGSEPHEQMTRTAKPPVRATCSVRPPWRSEVRSWTASSSWSASQRYAPPEVGAVGNWTIAPLVTKMASLHDAAYAASPWSER